MCFKSYEQFPRQQLAPVKFIIFTAALLVSSVSLQRFLYPNLFN